MTNSVLASMAVKISANTAEFGAALKQTNAQLKGFQTGLNQIGAALGVTFGATTAFNGLKAGIEIISSFEASMSEVKAITGATGKDFDDLTKSALDLGAATKFTAKEVSQLQVAYGRLGFTTKEILNATGATLDLAAATGEDLAKSADIAGSVVRAFNLDASETIRVADVMASSFNKSALGLDNFGEAMKYVAPVAANAGLSLEQTTAMLGVLADNGIRGSMAGTSLRKIISDLGKGAAPMLTKKLQELAMAGITGADAMDEVGRTAYASLLILAKNTEKVNEATTAYNNAAGSVGAMAAVMQDNLQGDVTKLTSAFEGMILKLRDGTPVLRSWAQDLTSIIDRISGNKTGQAFTKFNQLASQIRGGTAGQNQTISDLKELRKELGKPLNVNVDQLQEKYSLTTEQAKKLQIAVDEVNKSLSFDEAVIEKFNQFAKGYKSITEAASEYNAVIRQRMLANKGDELKAGQAGDKSLVNVIQEENEKLDRVTRTVYAYAQAKETASKVAPIVSDTEVKRVQTYTAAGFSMVKMLEDQRSAIKKFVTAYAELKNITSDIKMPDWDKYQKGFKNPLKDLITDFKLFKNELVELDLSGAVAGTLQGFATILGEFFADLNSGVGELEPFGNRLKKLVGGIMQAVGGALISIGIGKMAIKLPGPQAIAAGVALVAAGAALSKSANNAKKVLSGGSGSGGSSSSNGRAADNYEAQPVIIQVNGTWKAAGTELQLVLDKEKYKRGKVG